MHSVRNSDCSAFTTTRTRSCRAIANCLAMPCTNSDAISAIVARCRCFATNAAHPGTLKPHHNSHDRQHDTHNSTRLTPRSRIPTPFVERVEGFQFPCRCGLTPSTRDSRQGLTLKTTRKYVRISRNDLSRRDRQHQTTRRLAGRYNCELFQIRYSSTSVRIQNSSVTNAWNMALTASLLALLGNGDQDQYQSSSG